MSYSINVYNKCPNRIWFRAYKESNFLGNDIDTDEDKKFESNEQIINIQGFVWEKEDKEIWNPTFKTTLDPEGWEHIVKVIPILNGPRTSQSIKAFMACLAGPANPNERNDIDLMKNFIK